MIDPELRSNITRILAAEHDLNAHFRVLCSFRDRGGRQADALETLQDMRKGLSQEQEDRLLEVMDFAAGWCDRNYRVWP